MVEKFMKKAGLLLLVVLTLVACGKKEDSKIKIGITQIVEHPALDAARKGFMEVLQASEFASRVEFEEKSAQGDMAVAQTIAEGFVNDKGIPAYIKMDNLGINYRNILLVGEDSYE